MDFSHDQMPSSQSSQYDEDQSRPNNTVFNVKLELGDEHRKLLGLIKDTFQIPDSLYGVSVVTKELIIDLRALSKAGFVIVDDTVIFLHEFYRAFAEISGTDAESDRSQAWSLNVNEVRLMIRPLVDRYSIQEKQLVRADLPPITLPTDSEKSPFKNQVACLSFCA